MRLKFDEQLELLNNEMITMGALCEEAISAAGIELKDGDSIITTNLEFIQVALPWCLMRKTKDIDIRVCKTEDNRFRASDFAKLADETTKILVMSTVEWCNGCLGQGLSQGCGTALAQKLRGRGLFSAGAKPYVSVRMEKGQKPLDTIREVLESLHPPAGGLGPENEV